MEHVKQLLKGPRNRKVRFTIHVASKDADFMANSEDSDQTATKSSLIWVCTVCPAINIPIFRNLTVLNQFLVNTLTLPEVRIT